MTHQILLLCLILYFSERKEENADIAEITEAEVPAPAPAPAPTLRQSENDHTLQEQGSQQRTLGSQPAHIVTFTDTISTWISGYPVQCWTLRTIVHKSISYLLSRTMDTHIYRVVNQL